MSLLTFFADQRRRWFDHLTDYSTDYFAGAWAALLQAEVAFRNMPLYNGHRETHKVQLELLKTHDLLYQANRQAELARNQVLLAEPHLHAAKKARKDANRAAQHDRRQVSLTRKALVRMNAVAGSDEFEPEVRLRYLQHMITTHLTLLRDENPDVPRQ